MTWWDDSGIGILPVEGRDDWPEANATFKPHQRADYSLPS